jgi:uncharacterized protein (TIGR00661 family)
MQSMQDKPVQIKVAAFKQSSSKGMHIDWTLDALLDISEPDVISTKTNTFNIYFDQVSYYKPDLVISDLEYFTSYIATNLNIPLWQCSSSLLNFAIERKEKYNAGLFSRYAYLLKRDNALRTGRTLNIIENSEYNFIYSHLGDTSNPPVIQGQYKWIRPYHTVGKISKPCQHNIVACSHNDRKLLAMLKRRGDSVVFAENTLEQQQGLWIKDLANIDEYYCNLKNCRLFVCGGQTSFLADAFYNGKYAATMTNFPDLECVMNSVFSEHLGLSTMIYDEKDIERRLDKTVASGYNASVRCLSDYIDELI